MFTNQVWAHGEMDPIGKFITTNEFLDVEGLHIRLAKDSRFQTQKFEWRSYLLKNNSII
jgi:hypothetical protein